MKNIVHKVIRNIELKGYPKTNKIKYIENDKNVAKYKHSVNDSELLRMIEAIDSQNVFIETYGKLGHIYLKIFLCERHQHNNTKEDFFYLPFL